jgi:hypothetical protein
MKKMATGSPNKVNFFQLVPGLFLATAFVCFSMTGKAMEIIPPKNNWYFGVSIKLADNFRTKKYDYANSKPDSTDVSRFGINTGFILRHDLNERLQFETGIFFNNKGYQSREYIFPEYNSSPSFGQYVNYFRLQDIYDLWYMDVPLKLHYKFGIKRFFISAGAGMIINICLSSHNNGTVTQLTNNGPSNFTTYYFTTGENFSSGCSLSGEAALNYSFHTTLLSLFPFYEKSLFDAGSSAASRVFFYAFGVGINFSHRF